jgi:hypothetical protein
MGDGGYNGGSGDIAVDEAQREKESTRDNRK